MTVGTTVTPRRSELLRSRFARFRRTLAGLQRGDARALHAARVASRRLRELLPVLPSAAARKVRRRLRKVTAGLGAGREFDAMLPLIDERATGPAARTNPLDRLRAAVTTARDEARMHLNERLTAGDLRRLVRNLGRLVDDVTSVEVSKPAKPGARGWRWALDARVTRRAVQLADAIRDAGSVYLPDRLHRVRIAIKKLRYAVELAVEAGGEKTSADLRTLKRAQDLLGRLHDRQVLVDRVRQIQAAASAELRAERELEAIVDTLENECRRLHARYVRDRASLADICARSIAQPQAGPARRTASRRLAS